MTPTHPPVDGVSPLQPGHRSSLLSLLLDLPGDDGDVAHPLALRRPDPTATPGQRRPLSSSSFCPPRSPTASALPLPSPESQVQPVVFVLQQLFDGKHGRTQHVHLSQHAGFKGITSNPYGANSKTKGGDGGRLGCLVYRSLCAVLHVIDGQLDLSLLSDHGVLKEGHAAQVDGVTGALRTQRVGVGVGGF